MRRWLPFPLLSIALLAMWLLLNQSLAPGHILLGAVLGLLGPLAMATLEPPKARIRRPGVILGLLGLVLVDIARSNLAVARIILTPGRGSRRSGFVTVPLAMRDPYGLAVLACIVTATPGTLWVGFDSATGLLLMHILDLEDDAVWTQTIKDRYERRLMEIFE